MFFYYLLFLLASTLAVVSLQLQPTALTLPSILALAFKTERIPVNLIQVNPILLDKLSLSIIPFSSHSPKGELSLAFSTKSITLFIIYNCFYILSSSGILAVATLVSAPSPHYLLLYSKRMGI